MWLCAGLGLQYRFSLLRIALIISNGAMEGNPADSSLLEMMTKRVYELDLLRLFAALSVMFHHYCFRGYSADNMTVMPYPYLAPVARYGYLGVDLFFLISGFVIVMTTSKGSVRQFAISRATRLYPAFWLCCSLTFITTVLIGGGRYTATTGQYLVNMTMLGGFVGVSPIDGVYWSLFVEIRFYFLVFLILMSGMISKAKELLGIWLLVVIVLSIWQAKYISYFFITDYAPYFIGGAMFYFIYAEGPSLYKSFTTLASYAVALVKAVYRASATATHYHTSISPVLVAVMVTAFFIVFALLSTRKTSGVASPVYVVLGGLTYPLYLMHQNIGYMIFNLFYPAMNTHFLLWGTVWAMLLAAFLVSKVIERRLAALMRTNLERLAGVSVRHRRSPGGKIIGNDEGRGLT